MKALIVEDELAGQHLLKELLQTYCNQVNIIAAVSTVAEAVRIINAQKPDLVFLDIELPQENGMQLFSYYEEPNFKVIFTTSYNQYAVEAFRHAAVDYLLKPISGQELARAVDRASKKEQKPFKKAISSLQTQFDKGRDKIAIATVNGFEFYHIRNLVRTEAEGRYTSFYFLDGHRVISTKNIGEYEKLLLAKGFYRTHRSHLINLTYVSKYQRGNMPSLEMEDGSIIPVSGKKKEELLSKLTFNSK